MASFAARFSFVEILTTVFQLLFPGYGFGGAAFFWAWPIVFCGQVLVNARSGRLRRGSPRSGIDRALWDDEAIDCGGPRLVETLR